MELDIYETDKKAGKIDLKDLRKDFEEPLNRSDLCRVILTVMDAKPATDIEGFFSTEDEFKEFISRINSAGLNCYVEKEPEETVAESFAQFFDDEDRKNAMERIDSAELISRIFITSESYDEDLIKLIAGNNYGSKFHRKYGDFLGFDEDNIEAFTYFMMPKWKKLLYRLRKDRPPETLMPLEAIEKYRPESDRFEKMIYTSFTFQKIADRRKKFEESFSRAERRKEKVEKSDINLDFVLDALKSVQLDE